MRPPREPRPGPDLQAYGTRVAWGPAGGIARHDGVQVVLTECPQPLPGRALQALDYAPGLGNASACDVGGRPVTLSPAECALAHAWLVEAVTVPT